jgi:thiol-disulfide isomerase/thioredoxin
MVFMSDRMPVKEFFHCTGEYMRTYLYKVVPVVLALIMLTGSWSIAAVAMPEFSLPSAVDGKMVSSREFRGKVLLVTFFATWCPPCMQEVPTLIQLQKEMGPRGFTVLGLSVDEGGSGIVAKLVERRRINYPVLMANSLVAGAFGGISGIPTSFLVNKKGHVVKRYPGYVPHKILLRDIQALLK